MTKTVGTMKNDLFLEVMLGQELLDDLNHFLVTAGKTGTPEAYSDLSFFVFHG